MVEEQKAIADMKTLLQNIYKGDESLDGFFEPLGDDEVKLIAKKVSRGVFMASPVFDGAHESDIKAPSISLGSRTRGRRSSSTGAPAKRSIRTSRWASCTC